jgi:hypothetical protein
MGKSKNTVKVIGVGFLEGEVINLLPRSDLGLEAEQAIFIDQELLIDCIAGKTYFLKNNRAERWGFIPNVKRLKKYLWPWDEYWAGVLKGVDVSILDGDGWAV